MSFPFVDVVFWIAVGCCVIAQSAILYSVLRVSAARQSSSASTSASQPVSSRAAEIAWAVIPGVGLAFLLFFTWQAMR